MNTMHEYKVEIYRRILKYPPFACRRKPGPMEVVHVIGGGRAISRAVETVTPEDWEVMLAIALLVQRGEVKVHHSHDEKIDVVVVETTMARVAKLLCTNNYDRVWQSIRRLKLLVIEYHFSRGKMIMSLIHKAAWNRSTNSISIMLDEGFWKYCTEKPLTIDFNMYTLINSPVAKNLYSYITANSANRFDEDTLIERAVIHASRTDNARAILIDALNELVEKHVIDSYTKTKQNGKWVYEIKRKNYPQR